MCTLFLLLLPSLSLCAPPFSQELKNCDDSVPRASELSLNSALSTFLCYTEEEIGAMDEVDKKRNLAQKIAPLDLVEEMLNIPSDSLVLIVNEVMNNRNTKTIEEYRAVFDEHQLETKVDSLSFNPQLNSDVEDRERNGRDASFLPSIHSWFNFREDGGGSLNIATPQILTSSQTFRVSVGDSVILPCSVHDLGTLVPLWKHKEHVLTAGKQIVNPDSFKYQLINDYNLQIRNVRALDAGDYTCFITTFGQPVTLTHTIKILSLGTPEETPTATKISDAKEVTTAKATSIEDATRAIKSTLQFTAEELRKLTSEEKSYSEEEEELEKLIVEITSYLKTYCFETNDKCEPSAMYIAGKVITSYISKIKQGEKISIKFLQSFEEKKKTFDDSATVVIIQAQIQTDLDAWAPWTAYSSCTKTCGGGTQTRTRTCTYPSCEQYENVLRINAFFGQENETKDCNLVDCD